MATKKKTTKAKIKARVQLPSVKQLCRATVDQLLSQRRLFIGITIVYGVLLIVFVRGLGSGVNVNQLKSSLNATSKTTSAATNLAVFGLLLGSSSSSSSDLTSLYQTLILIIVSLAFIWALRHAGEKKPLQIRDAFYKSTHAFIPFLAVLLVISLELIPLVIANLIYANVIQGGIAVNGMEKGLWLILVFGLIILSLFLLTSSIFGLYIVTLPDTRPLQALKAAKKLVRLRRWTVMRKLLALPLILVLLLSVVTIPTLMLLPVIAGWVFFLASILVLPLFHSYMYALYRSLL